MLIIVIVIEINDRCSCFFLTNLTHKVLTAILRVNLGYLVAFLILSVRSFLS